MLSSGSLTRLLGFGFLFIGLFMSVGLCMGKNKIMYKQEDKMRENQLTIVCSCAMQTYKSTGLTSGAYRFRISQKGEGTIKENVDGDGTKRYMVAKSLDEDSCARSCMILMLVHIAYSKCLGQKALSVPTIAAIEGAALGGGLELVLSCDLRICGVDAIFSMPETGLAIIPGAGGTQRLPRIVGRSTAKELIFTGRRVGGKEALDIGLVNYCVSAGEAYQKALQIARDINQKGPLATRMAKQAINRGLEVAMSSALAVEEECYAQLLNTEDRLEGLAAYAEKREPRYTGK